MVYDFRSPFGCIFNKLARPKSHRVVFRSASQYWSELPKCDRMVNAKASARAIGGFRRRSYPRPGCLAKRPWPQRCHSPLGPKRYGSHCCPVWCPQKRLKRTASQILLRFAGNPHSPGIPPPQSFSAEKATAAFWGTLSTGRGQF